MKKRAMKKYIPRDTEYCYRHIFQYKNGVPVRSNYCKNLIFKGFRTDYFTSDEMGEIPIKVPVFRCRYTGTEPIDDCKDCLIGTPKYPEECEE